jgi:hypothetical protein
LAAALCVAANCCTTSNIGAKQNKAAFADRRDIDDVAT